MTQNSVSKKIGTWTTGQVVLATVFVVCVLTAFWLIYQTRLVIFLLFAAMILGTAIRPGVDWLRERGVLRPVGVIVIYTILTALFIGFLSLIAPFFADQFTQFFQDLPKYYQDFRAWALGSSNQLLHNLGMRIPTQIILLISRAPDTGQVLDQVAQTFVYANLIMKGLFEIMAVFLLAYYWTQESSLIIRAFLQFVPQQRRAGIRDFIHTAEMRMGGYIRGQAVLCLIVGSAALIAYTVIGLPFAPVLGIIAGITELIPVVGPGLGAIPAVLIALSVDPGKVIWVLAAVALIQGMENAFLVPHIMKNSMGVNPIIIILSLVAFGSVFGFLGAIIALPAAAIIQLTMDRAVSVANDPEPKDKPKPPRLDKLLVESQELDQSLRNDINGNPALLQLPRQTAEEIRSITDELAVLLKRVGDEEGSQ